MQQLDPIIVYESCDTNLPFYSKEDVAQELRLHLWQVLPSWDGRASLKTWAKKVIKNKIKDLYKKETKTQKRKDYLHTPFSSMVAECNLTDDINGEDRNQTSTIF